MPYTPTVWVNGVAPALSAANLNNLETQILEAKKKMKPPLVRWTSPGWAWNASANQAIAANRIYYMLIYVEEPTTYIRIGINVGVGDGVGGLADLRIFACTAGVPGVLILSAGTVSTNAAGLKEIVITQALITGYYFLAVRGDQTPSLKAPSTVQPAHAPTSGLSLTGDMLNKFVILYDDAAYADPAGAVDGGLGIDWAFITLREN